MNRIFLLLAVFLLFLNQLFSQNQTGSHGMDLFPDARQVRENPSGPVPLYAELGSGWSEKEVLDRLQAAYKSYPGLQFDKLGSETDASGTRHQRYRATLSGALVFGLTFILHEKSGEVHSFNGSFPFLDWQPGQARAVSEDLAVQRAIASVGAERYKWQMPEEEALLKKESNNPLASYFPKGEPVLFPGEYPRLAGYRLSWNCEVYADKPLVKRSIFVDMETGKLLWFFDKIHVVDLTATANTKYSGTQEIKTTAITGGFRLRETERGGGIETYDMNQGTAYGSAVDFTDSDNLWDNFNAQLDEVATDAHWGAEMTYDYFKLKFNRNSIDNAGFALKSYVHYDVDYANAFWDGARMTYGDGNTTMDPLTTLDITAHEITHGLTSYTANLDYAFESGALNEGFSDVFATAIEFFAKPTDANWTIGEDIGNIIRSLSNPNSQGQPDTYHGNLWYSGTGDNGGVHYNSGVLNYWFYLVSQGGSGINDLNNAFTVTAQGIDKAAAVAYRTLTYYLTNTSVYEDARFYSILAAINLYGACSPEVESVTRAWYAVGLGPNYVNQVVSDFSADFEQFCTVPAVVNFENLSVNGQSFVWSFGDGGSSTSVSPSHTYTNYGLFNVSLVVQGGSCGQDTLINAGYISISPTNPCNIVMATNGAMPAQTGCAGTLYDSGGMDNYQDETSSTLTIAPLGAVSLTVVFSSFDFETDYDYLYIYDGPDASSTLIGQFTGNTLPLGGTIQSTTGALTFVQTSDVYVTGSGFVLTWQCSFAAAAPLCNFKTSRTISCSGTFLFSDQSLNGPTEWLWDFGDGQTSTLQHPQHTYQSEGTFSVKLWCSNAYGMDSLIRPNYVTVLFTEEVIPSNGSHCGPGPVDLSADATGPVFWFDDPAVWQALDTGLTFTTPNLIASDIFYATSNILSGEQTGKPDNSGGGGYFTNTNIHYQIFDVYSPVLVRSVKVYAQTAGERAISLRNASGDVLMTRTVNIPAGESRVNLDFRINPGNNYQLAGPGTPNLYRNNGGCSYPYKIDGLISVKNSSAGAGVSYNYYYYFYDWEVYDISCFGERVPVQAMIEDLPVSAFSYTSDYQTVSFSNSATPTASLLWEFGDGQTSTDPNPVHTYAQAGTYQVRLTASNSCGSDTSSQFLNLIYNLVDEPVGQNTLVVYPNPVAHNLSLKLPDHLGNVEVEVFDLPGRRVLQPNRLEEVASELKLDVSSLPPGAYLVQVNGEGKVFSGRFFIQR